MKTLMRPVLLAAALAAAGCGTYRQDYSFDPAPAVSGEAAPRVLGAIYGVLRGDDTDPPGIDVRLRLEAGEETAEVVRDDLQLVTADLVPLELVSSEPAGGLVAPAGGAGTWRLVFAFPAGHDVASLDLTGLVLSWRVRVGEATQAGSFRFSKIPEPIWVAPAYYGPWWHGPWGTSGYGWYFY